jgi:hypothetical protein
VSLHLRLRACDSRYLFDLLFPPPSHPLISARDYICDSLFSFLEYDTWLHSSTATCCATSTITIGATSHSACHRITNKRSLSWRIPRTSTFIKGNQYTHRNRSPWLSFAPGSAQRALTTKRHSTDTTGTLHIGFWLIACTDSIACRQRSFSAFSRRAGTLSGEKSLAPGSASIQSPKTASPSA